MNVAQKRNFLIARFKRNYRPKNSKWYPEDAQNFIAAVYRIPDEQVDQMYQNAVAFDSPAFNAAVEAEEEKMFRAGMYDVDKMGPKNMLD